MKISRRNFIKTGTLAVFVIGANLFKPTALPAQKRMSADDLNLIGPLRDPILTKTADDFSGYIGAEFILLTADTTVSAILSEVTNEMPKRAKEAGFLNKSSRSRKSTAQNFVLSFKLPSDEFPQATYQLWHPDFGQFNLFLVPSNHDKLFLLHAVINRL